MALTEFSGTSSEDCWSQEDDQISAQYQYQTVIKLKDRDTISQMSVESSDSREPIFFQVAHVHTNNLEFAVLPCRLAISAGG